MFPNFQYNKVEVIHCGLSVFVFFPPQLLFKALKLEEPSERWGVPGGQTLFSSTTSNKFSVDSKYL